MLELIIKYEDGDSSTHIIDQPVMRIGRRTDNDIVIPDSYVSGYHAEFQRLDNGDYEIVDQDSHNGTTVNGKKAKRNKVKPGDVIIFGILEATVDQGPDAPKVAPMKPPRVGAKRRPTANPLAKTLSHTLTDRKMTGGKMGDLDKRLDGENGLGAPVSELQDKVKAAQAEIAELRVKATGAEGRTAPSAAAGSNDGGDSRDLSWRDRLANRGIEKREKKIEALESYLAEKTAQLKLVRQQLAELSKAAKKQDSMRREIEAMQIEHEELKRRNSQMREFEAQLAKREKDLVSIEEKLAAHAQTRDKHDREITQRRKELERLNQELKDTESGLKKEEERFEQVRNDIESSASINADLVDENEQLKGEVETRKLQLDKDQGEIAATERELTVMREDINSTRKTLRTLSGRELRLTQTSSEGREVETKINELWDEHHVIQDEIEHARKDRDLAFAQRQEISDEIIDLKGEQTQLRQGRDRLQGEARALESQRREAEEKSGVAEKKADQFRVVYDEMRTKRDELAEERQKLRTEIQEFENQRDEAEAAAIRSKNDLEDAKGAFERDNSELFQLRKDLNGERKKLDGLLSSQTKAQQERDHAEEMAKEVREEMDSYADKREGLQTEIKELEVEAKKKAAVLTETEEALLTAKDSLDESKKLRTEIETNRKQLTEIQEKIGTARKERSRLEETNKDVVALADDLSGSRRRIQDRIDELDDELTIKDGRLRSTSDQVMRLTEKLARSKADVEDFDSVHREELERLEDLRDEVAEQESTMEERKAEVAEIREDRNKLELQAKDLRHEIDESERHIKEITVVCARIDEDHEKKQTEIKRVEDQLKTLQEAMSKTRLDLNSERELLSDEKEKREDARAAAKAELQKVQTDREREQSTLKLIKSEYGSVEATLDDTRAKIREREIELTEQEDRCKKTLQEVKDIELEKEKIASELDGRDRELANKRKNVDELTNHLKELRDMVDERNNELIKAKGGLREEKEQHEKWLRDKRAELDNLDQQIDQSHETVKLLNEDIEAQRLKADEAHRQTKVEVDRLEASERSLRERIDLGARELRDLEGSLRSIRTNVDSTTSEQREMEDSQLSRISELGKKRKHAEDELATKLKDIEEANQRAEQISALTREVEDKQGAIGRATSELEKRQDEVRDFEEREEQLLHRIRELEAKSDRLQTVGEEVETKERDLEKLEERTSLLQDRQETLLNATSPESGTIQVFASELLRRIDLLEDLIAKYRRSDQPGERDIADQMGTLREALFDTLRNQSVRPFDFDAGHRIDLKSRRLIKIVETKSDRPKNVTKIVETLRRGYLYLEEDGREIILRKADVITSNP
ncbi:MAG: chromosome segregation ATPase [Verrucomicrobiales bacterium]|jgi:chromosome segregation ATPase